jgi:hypothetical protein
MFDAKKTYFNFSLSAKHKIDVETTKDGTKNFEYSNLLHGKLILNRTTLKG